MLVVKQLKIKDDAQARLGKRYKTLAIEADFFRQPQDQPLASTESQGFTAETPIVNFNDKLEMQMRRDGDDAKSKANRRRVSTAIENETKHANIEISLVGRSKDEKGDVVATGTIEVGSMWKDQEDLRDFSLQLLDDSGRPVGTLSVDCLAMQALRSLSLTRDASSARQPAAPSIAPQHPPPVRSGSATGRTAAAEPTKQAEGEGKVWVRVDEVKVEELAAEIASAGWSVTGNECRDGASIG